MKKEEKENQKIIDEYDYLSNAASSHDCTGLIPSEPVSAEEIESYEELYHFLPPNARAASIKPEAHAASAKPDEHHR
ncbi:MAG: hypothetical protein HFG92_15470 [Dorea sp.]|jgi:hypothetical protein|nr:hypothetical protein [Dorea sp.]MDE6829649.1 hypothetical protein [Lachnospiraceae bacterium]